MAVQDLNDISFFAAVVENKGFSAAARALGLPKSTLSRHVGRLEKRLGVRLLERSTRHFRLTDVGEHYYGKAREILDELNAADKELAEMRSAPCGVVRLAAPLAAAQYVLPLILPAFMARHPLIKLQVLVSDRPVDLIGDRIDIAIRVRAELGNEALTMKKLTSSYRVLVASPAFAAQHKVGELKCLSVLPFLSSNESEAGQSITLVGPAGRREAVSVAPRLMTTDFNLVREAAIAGQGIAFLPIEVVAAAIGEGRLMRVLPEWQSEKATIHLVFAGQKSLTPAGRLLVDYLAAEFEPMVRRHGLSPQ
jgi:DNA-binding transcriptional LysR family regulator